MLDLGTGESINKAGATLHPGILVQIDSMKRGLKILFFLVPEETVETILGRKLNFKRGLFENLV